MVKVLTKTFVDWNYDKVPRLSASVAFYSLLSAAPLLLVVVAVAALAYGQDAARGQLVREIRGLVGADRARAIQDLILSAYNPGSGLIATILGVLTLALGASAVVVELRDALNTIWHVPVPPGNNRYSALICLLKERSYSFALVVGGGVLLLFSLTLSALFAAMGRFIGAWLPAPEFLLQAGAFLMSFLVTTLLFAAIYKFLPDVSLKWSDVAVGACVTALFFDLGKLVIGLYLGKSTFGSAYGAAGSLVMLLLWMFYSAQVFFFGAEFTKVYTQMRASAGKSEPG